MVKFGHTLNEASAELEPIPLLGSTWALQMMAAQYKVLKKLIKQIEQESELESPTAHPASVTSLKALPRHSALDDTREKGMLTKESHDVRCAFATALDRTIYHLDDAFARLPTIKTWEAQLAPGTSRMRFDAQSIARYCDLTSEGIRKIAKKFDKRCGNGALRLQDHYAGHVRLWHEYAQNITQLLNSAGRDGDSFVMDCEGGACDAVSAASAMMCSVCLCAVDDHIESVLDLATQLPCGHRFHRRCFANQAYTFVQLARHPSLNVRARGGLCCPLCREPVSRRMLYESLFDYVFFVRHPQCSLDNHLIEPEVRECTSGNAAVSALKMYSAWRQHVAYILRTSAKQEACGSNLMDCAFVDTGDEPGDEPLIYCHLDPQVIGVAVHEARPSAAELYWETPTSEVCGEVATTSRIDNLLSLGFYGDSDSVPALAELCELRNAAALQITQLLPTPLDPTQARRIGRRTWRRYLLHPNMLMTLCVIVTFAGIFLGYKDAFLN